ncbi:hypothetical protein HOLleu_20080 [Holothuria leucospilota]|uniref:Death domain-containing protein n=1 Tax=Holothuria leucospilota TaxID=206669 RepID=A0A9Q1C122_HOLLE|nr:hypothetical protein HOLleu_20080 [Holothuria leucospilota]
MAARIYEDVYGTGFRHRDRRRIFSIGSKSTSKASSTQLRHPLVLSMKPHCPFNVSFTIDDKLIIIFGYEQTFVVYKKSNSTVAVLQNVTFKERSPPMMFDGAKLGALLHKIEPKLMYAVAKKDFGQPNGILFHQNDVALILAQCRDIFLGITEGHRVGFFPTETVTIITKPKPCFFEGMILTVKAVVNFLGEDQKVLSVYQKEEYEITKGRNGLFDWFGSNQLKVPLHSVAEVGTTAVYEMIDGNTYDTLSGCQELPNADRVYPNNQNNIASQEVNIPSSPLANDCKPRRRSNTSQPLGKQLSYENIQNIDSCSDETEDRRYSLSNQDTTTPTYPPLIPPPPPLPPRDYTDLDEDDSHKNADLICFDDEPNKDSRKQDINYKGGGHNKVKDSSLGNSGITDASVASGTTFQEPKMHFEREAQLSKSSDKTSANDNHLYETPNEGEDLKKAEDEATKDLLVQLCPYRDLEINDTLRLVVAEYVEPGVWRKLGTRIKISQNRLKDLEDWAESIYDKTYGLLGIWHQNFGCGAKVGVLIDALVEVEPVELQLILEGILRKIRDSERDPNLYSEIPEKRSLQAASGVNEEPHYEVVQACLKSLDSFRDIEINEQIKTIVKQYIDDDVWHPLGNRLEISKNIRKEIATEKHSIYEKTYDVLSRWHESCKKRATLGVSELITKDT